jgi:PAS domain S-box-containing protein
MTQNQETAEQLFTGNSEMAVRMRSQDWSQTLLGQPEQWSQSLRSALSICLNSRFPIAIYWGQDHTLLYNDAWRPIVGDKHPWALGRPAQEVWAEIWDDIGAELAGVLASGEGTFHKDDLLSMHRFGYTEECFFEYTFNPIRGQDSGVDGVFNIVTETTYRVLSDRRSRLLREIASKTGIAKTTEAACALMIESLKSDALDIPIALLYLITPDGKQAHLHSDQDSTLDSSVSPAVIDLDIDLDTEDNLMGGLIIEVVQTAQPLIVTDLESRFGALPASPWGEPPQEAVVLPLTASQGKVSGVLVAVASPRRRLDDSYRDFFLQAAGQVALAIANARAYEEARQRAEALAEIDRAKTTFFNNISHEFRTPLTLMLGPLEDALGDLDDVLSLTQRSRIETVQRNGTRLLKLVNTLLDFSRIEAGRVQASYEPTDLATLTAELSSMFRSAIERANLKLIVDCPPLPEAVYVDREMWEKIVLNLLSNAFKFTFEGEVYVGLAWANQHVELTVRDTGIGIPAAELPHLFGRFHRVKGAQGRSIEGSGIGLSLVQELVKLHGGIITVSSIEGAGTCFAISIPTGIAHLPPEQLVAASRTLTQTASGTNTYVEEALRWLPEESRRVEQWMSRGVDEPPSAHSPVSSIIPIPKIILADDNADMRDYIQRLLSQHYEVEAVADGVAALSAVHRHPPDLILTDVMMPNLDGFSVLRSLRADEQTRDIPIILLSARAGEEARIEGLSAGADDYLVKPFSARELLARVEATLKLARIRKESEQALAQSRRQFEKIAGTTPDIVYVFDLIEGCNTYINTGISRMLGYSPQQIAEMGSSLLATLIHPDDLPAIITGNDRFNDMDDEDISDRELRMRHVQGDYRWLRCRDAVFERTPDGKAAKIIGTAQDITDRKQAEVEREQLLQREQILRATAESAENQLRDLLSSIREDFVLFDRQWRIAYVNPQAAITMQRTQQTVLGQNMWELFPDLVGTEFCDRLHQVMQDQVPTQFEYYYPTWDQWFENRVYPTSEGIINLCSNITEKKRIEVEREQLLQREQAAREQAEQANRLKDEFLAVLSHELRSPLNPILGWVRILQSNKLNPERQTEALKTIERNAKLQSQLIEDLLDISRIVRGKLSLVPAPVSLLSVILAAYETVQLAAEAKGIDIRLDLESSSGEKVEFDDYGGIDGLSVLPEEMIWVSGDAARLQQAVWNLLTNAVKFTPSEGQVTVELRRLNQWAQIQVIDTGKGIQPEFLPYVFEYFRQEDGSTTRKFGGLGLGLAIVRQIVEMHGGIVWVESAGEQQGATFTIQLPLGSPPSSVVLNSPSDRGFTAPPLSGCSILLVDDEADARELQAFILEQSGAIVTAAASGIEALQAFDQHIPDILISDVGMAELDGYMLIRQIRSRPPQEGGRTPAIALTAYAGDFNQQQALAAGFQRHLTKPVDPQALVAAIADLLGYL